MGGGRVSFSINKGSVCYAKEELNEFGPLVYKY